MPEVAEGDWRYGTGGVALPVFLDESNVIKAGVRDTWTPHANVKAKLAKSTAKLKGLFNLDKKALEMEMRRVEEELKENHRSGQSLISQYSQLSKEICEEKDEEGSPDDAADEDKAKQSALEEIRSSYLPVEEKEAELFRALVAIEESYRKRFEPFHEGYSKEYSHLPTELERVDCDEKDEKDEEGSPDDAADAGAGDEGDEEGSPDDAADAGAGDKGDEEGSPDDAADAGAGTVDSGGEEEYARRNAPPNGGLSFAPRTRRIRLPKSPSRLDDVVRRSLIMPPTSTRGGVRAFGISPVRYSVTL